MRNIAFAIQSEAEVQDVIDNTCNKLADSIDYLKKEEAMGRSHLVDARKELQIGVRALNRAYDYILEKSGKF